MTSPEVIFTICRRTTASPYHIFKSLMKHALASQRKNTIGWCVKRWQQTVNNRNHWQVDDGRSTAGMFVTFPENWHSIKKQNNLSPVVTLLIFCYFAEWFWKKPDFSIVLWGKARFEPKYLHFSSCHAKQHRGRSDQCKMGLTGLPDSYGSCHLYICCFVSVSWPFMSLHSCLWRVLCVVL